MYVGLLYQLVFKLWIDEAKSMQEEVLCQQYTRQLCIDGAVAQYVHIFLSI